MDGSQVFLASVAPFSAGGKDYQFHKPAGYDSDNLLNNEFGYKSEWFDHRVLFNASLYQEDWKNVQLSLFDPVHLGNTTFNVNGPTYRVRGFEIQFVAKIWEGLTVEGSGSWNSSEQTRAPCLASNRVAANNPTPIGQCITQVKGLPYTNPYGEIGQRAPFSPPQQFNVRARYDWATNGYNTYAFIGASHIGSYSNEPANFPDGNSPAQNPPTTTLLRYQIPGYTTWDGGIGCSKDAWTAQLLVYNLADSDSVTNISSGQFIKSQIPLRPRVMTFSLGYKF
jgi:outer membrane receptor protein involved in Fe transport